MLDEVEELSVQLTVHEKSTEELQKSIEVLKFNINKWENELATLKARAKVANATKLVNKQMAKIDANSTISMLERMKTKVEEDEALAQAYGDLAKNDKSADDKINQFIKEDYLQSELDTLKNKLANEEKI